MNILSLIASNSFIMYNKHIARNTSVNAGILVAYFASVYDFASKTNSLHLGEWFFCTSEDTYENTILTPDKQDAAIKILIEKGLLIKKIMGIPAKRFFKFPSDFDKKILEFGTKNKFPEKKETAKKQSKNDFSYPINRSIVFEKVVNQFPEKKETIYYNRDNIIENYNRINICENSIFSLNLNDDKISKIRMNAKQQNKTNMETNQELNQLRCENQTNQQESIRNPIGFKIGNDNYSEGLKISHSKPDFSTQKQEWVVLPNKQEKEAKLSLKRKKNETQITIVSEGKEKTSTKPCLITETRFTDYQVFDAEFRFADEKNTANPHQFEYVDTLKLWEVMITDAEARGSKANKYTNFIAAARNWARMAENNKRFESYIKSTDVMYDYTINTFLEKFGKGTHQITSEDKMYAVKLVEKIKRVKTQPDLKAAIDNLLFSPQFGLIGHIQRETNNPTKPKVFSHFTTFKSIYNHFDLIKQELMNVFNEYKAKRENERTNAA